MNTETEQRLSNARWRIGQVIARIRLVQLGWSVLVLSDVIAWRDFLVDADRGLASIGMDEGPTVYPVLKIGEGHAEEWTA